MALPALDPVQAQDPPQRHPPPHRPNSRPVDPPKQCLRADTPRASTDILASLSGPGSQPASKGPSLVQCQGLAQRRRATVINFLGLAAALSLVMCLASCEKRDSSGSSGASGLSPTSASAGATDSGPSASQTAGETSCPSGPSGGQGEMSAFSGVRFNPSGTLLEGVSVGCLELMQDLTKCQMVSGTFQCAPATQDQGSGLFVVGLLGSKCSVTFEEIGTHSKPGQTLTLVEITSLRDRNAAGAPLVDDKNTTPVDIQGANSMIDKHRAECA
jgi:hypothetical protein